MIILLLVDDDEMSRDIIGSRLTRLGYAVITAVDGRQGIEAARDESPNLILMDLCMPEMDGFEAAKQLKADGTTVADSHCCPQRAQYGLGCPARNPSRL